MYRIVNLIANKGNQMLGERRIMLMNQMKECSAARECNKKLSEKNNKKSI